ncbi:plastocyanin/azurin family copper-binding protein [Saliphagus infecundisoli]|uniref:Plastocyanin/azurin family copper-binding protein n=1 Tax=Saliphagus infecundisoli TaxID=1849069 RepID=A0ABD5QEL7_9EURY|nr:plastocyanin/azurin family copper-binding protein [Saliphagus infecundisoli]
MNRREALVAVGSVLGAGSAVTAVMPVGAQEDGSGGNESGGNETGGGSGGNETQGGGNESGGGNQSGNASGGGGGGATETVNVVDNAFEPAELTIEPGTTVEWAWQGTQAQHNVVPDSQPEGAGWEGHTSLESGDFSFSSTFETEGDYEYICEPHVSQGMTGTITVTTDTGGGQAEADVDIHDLGVPIQKQYVGVASFLATFVSLVFTFYLLKYGESANTSSPGRDR